MISRAPLLPLAVALLLGSALSLGGQRPPAGSLLTLPLALSPPLAPLAFLAAGWWAADLARAPEPVARPVHPGPGLRAAPGQEGEVHQAPTDLSGRVVSVPAPFGGRLRFNLLTDDGRRLEVLAPPLEWPLAAGDRIRLRARLRTPPGARNPGASDPRARLAAVGVAQQAEGLLPPVRLAPPSPLAWLERGRERFAEAAAALPPRQAALVRAIGTGDRAALDQPTTESFARSGLAHVLAVSGLHLVVVAVGLERLLRAALLRVGPLADRWDARRLAAALTLPAVVAYALATGAGFPVVRAAIASAAIFGATLLDREGSAANTLGLAALAVLGVEPGALLDPSLQLSLASVAGLVALAGPLRAALPVARPPPGTWRARLLEPLLAGLCATLAASLATAPILALHFRRLPALGVLANLVGVPLGTGLTALTAIAAALAAAWPPLALPVLWCCWPLASALLAVSDAAAAPSFAVVGVASPGPLLAGVACALALSLARLRGAWRWGAAIAFVACLALPGPVRAAAARRRGVLEVVFVSVGQGDASLLRLPGGGAVLIDGGGTFPGGPDPGARDLVPLLRDIGVTRLAAVVVSHPHPDHVLGLPAVAAAFPVDRVVLGGGPPGPAAAGALGRLPAPLRLPLGGALELEGVRLERVGGDAPGLEENDASLVLRVTFGRTALLFPGDLEEAGEAAALASGRPLRADLVKVPHHGSRTSSTAPFTRAVCPAFAVASVGAGNRYGFPHAEAVARWREVGAAWRQTDEGAVRFVSDGERLEEVPAANLLDPLALWREGRGASGPRGGEADRASGARGQEASGGAAAAGQEVPR
jgi:competence protein ComEC